MIDPVFLVYSIADLCLALIISVSNLVVIVVYLRARHIRRTPINAYIFSLAITDFLAGAVGIPLTVISVLTRWPFTFFPCLAIHLILCVLCTISTFHLLAMAIHKYLSICQKKIGLQRSTIRSKKMKRLHFLIIGLWIFGSFLGSLPLLDGFGFATKTMGNFKGECHFSEVVDYRYLVFIIFIGTIVVPSILIAFCYISIYSYIRHEAPQILCHLQAAERQRRHNSKRKLTRTLILLVTTFAICWYPLYIINTLDLFFNLNAGRPATLTAVVLSHANCAVNPVIYAYGVPGFKQSLRRYFLFFSPVSNISMQGTGAACGVPLPGINAHAAWYNNLAKKQSCGQGGGGGHGRNVGIYVNGRKVGAGAGGAIGNSIDARRRQSVAQIGTNGTTAPTLNDHLQPQQQHGGGRRAMSTVNPPTAFPIAIMRESSRCGGVAQFRRHQQTESQPLKQQQPQIHQSSTETDETVAEECVVDRMPPQQQISTEDSFDTNSSSNENCRICPEEADRKRSGQSIASRMSVWSLRIFSGQWRALRRRTSSAQSLRESSGGGMLFENRTETFSSNIGRTKKNTKSRNRQPFNSEERRKLRSSADGAIKDDEK
ncbi:hypothetical protein niasHS_009187 [Heterodera schachtii]|uniref:G-protein coupled receptors family 1 profile domain-containing protein n=1 Tax=Heterodera schachtii TaxID=97005 RepID=A0ABD2IVV4_HETSC